METAFDTHLEEVRKGTGGHWLFIPNTFLITPETTEVSADFRSEFLPVLTMQAIQSNQVNLVNHVVIVMVAHGSLQDIHFGARGEQDCTSEVLLVEGFFHGCETIEKLSCSLVITNVDDLVSV